MAKFYGKVGFLLLEETAPGVHTPVDVEKLYAGDMTRVTQKWERSENLNEGLNLSSKLSIVMDQFANTNIGRVRYIDYLGSKWKVTSLEVVPPRVYLTIGGLYNG